MVLILNNNNQGRKTQTNPHVDNNIKNNINNNNDVSDEDGINKWY